MSLSKWLPCDFEQCHPLLWSGGILVDHWSTISSWLCWQWLTLLMFQHICVCWHWLVPVSFMMTGCTWMQRTSNSIIGTFNKLMTVLFIQIVVWLDTVRILNAQIRWGKQWDYKHQYLSTKYSLIFVVMHLVLPWLPYQYNQNPRYCLMPY